MDVLRGSRKPKETYGCGAEWKPRHRAAPVLRKELRQLLLSTSVASESTAAATSCCEGLCQFSPSPLQPAFSPCLSRNSAPFYSQVFLSVASRPSPEKYVMYRKGFPIGYVIFDPSSHSNFWWLHSLRCWSLIGQGNLMNLCTGSLPATVLLGKHPQPLRSMWDHEFTSEQGS